MQLGRHVMAVFCIESGKEKAGGNIFGSLRLLAYLSYHFFKTSLNIFTTC
jgi:hypothetical protein